MAATGLEPPERSYGAYSCEIPNYRMRHRLSRQHDLDDCETRESSFVKSWQAL